MIQINNVRYQTFILFLHSNRQSNPMENNHEENNIVRQCRDNWCEFSRRTHDLLVTRDGQEPKKTSWTGMIFVMTSRTQTAEALKSR